VHQFSTDRTLCLHRPTAVHWHLHWLLASLLISGAFFVLFPAQSRAAGLTPLEREEVKDINDFRVDHGLKRLKIDVTLTKAARWMGNDMTAYDYFSHDDHLGRDPFDRLKLFGYPSDTYRGENLAAGYPDAWNTFVQWRESPGHRANMLKAEYTSIGIALVEDENATYGHYWVTEFGSRLLKEMPSAKVQKRLEGLSNVEKRKIRKAARQCAKSAGRAKGRKAQRSCSWNQRMASHLESLAI
jgi:hypothetical protein